MTRLTTNHKTFWVILWRRGRVRAIGLLQMSYTVWFACRSHELQSRRSPQTDRISSEAGKQNFGFFGLCRCQETILKSESDDVRQSLLTDWTLFSRQCSGPINHFGFTPISQSWDLAITVCDTFFDFANCVLFQSLCVLSHSSDASAQRILSHSEHLDYDCLSDLQRGRCLLFKF